MTKKVFIDGSAGTTGLRIHERLADFPGIELISLSEDLRKDLSARKAALNSADVAFLCLPDAAAKEAVELIENENTVVIDTSTAHRTEPGWAYGFAELSESHRGNIRTSKRIAVPGCHASGFIALVYPLIEAGVLKPDALLSCFSVTGYSGGGKKMIAEYEDESPELLLGAPRIYGLTQSHKHLKEMAAVTGISSAPAFFPTVAPFYSGMEVTVPLFPAFLKDGTRFGDIEEIYKSKYASEIVSYSSDIEKSGFVSAATLSNKDSMKICLFGNSERISPIAVYDNLGKGASGAAVECLNIVLGLPETNGLVL